MVDEASLTVPFRSAFLEDSHGRIIRYVRVSVTDRCNLCCRYCRNEKTPFIPHERILRFEEIEKLLALVVGFGVHKVRFTGGEPFARKNFLDFLRRVRQRFPQLGLKVTSNGTLLGNALKELKSLGVAVNLSLDTLDRRRYAAITGRDLLPIVLENIHRMLEMGIPLKINAVAMKGVNDGEVFRLANLTMDHPVDVRFIEFMPIGEESIWSRDLFWSAADILAAVRQYFELEPGGIRPPHKERENYAEELGPARIWKLKDRLGRRSSGNFGLISPVTESFCQSCNRLRLTADGRLRTCLFDDREYALREALRRLGPEAAARIMVAAVKRKPLGAKILTRSQGTMAKKYMSAIGG